MDAPAIPQVEKTNVPVSALFSAEELTPPAPIVSSEPTTPLPAAKPAETPAPAAKPAETPAPAAKPAEVAPAPAAKPAETPAPEVKIKVGDKEYTKAELEKALADRTAAPAPAPAATPAPAAPAPVPPTPEQIAEAETNWQAKFIADEKLSAPFTEKEMETILTGDKEGAALLSTKLNQVVAKAVMLARKSVYAELNPELARLRQNLQPVLVNQAQVEGAAAEQQFITLYPDFKNHLDTCKRVGEALLTRFPKECAGMTREQLLAEVAAQSDRIIQAECDRFAPGKNWRQLQQAAPAPVAAAPAPAVPAPVAAAPAPAPAKIQAPGSNSPAGSPVGGAGPDWNKQTAASLAD